MNENRGHSEGAQKADDGSDLLAELIRQAGRRELPPPEHYERVFAAASDALHAKREQRRGRRRYRALAVAASVCCLAVGGLIWQGAGLWGEDSFRIERAIGVVEWRASAEHAWQALDSAAGQLAPSSEVRTASGASISLSLDIGMDTAVSLRLAGETTVALRSADSVYLEGGKAYVDSGRDTDVALQVVTPAATATDVGTQFEVRYLDGIYRLRVREGRVFLTSDSTELNGSAGDQLTIDRQGEVDRASIAPDDPDWSWAESLAPAPQIDGKPLTVLLEWIERETGREVIYADPVLELKAKQTIMHGTVRNLTPLQALDVALATTDMASQIGDDGKIVVYYKSNTTLR